MKRVIFVVVLMLGMSATTLAQRIDAALIDDLSQFVVLIFALDANGEPLGTGSGTVVSADGMIFTNRHVVEGASDFEIYILEDINERPQFRYYASVSLLFEEIDFAILQIDRNADGNAVLRTNINLPFLDPSNVAEVQRGDEVFVFGYPGVSSGFLTTTAGGVTTIQNGDVCGVRMPVWIQTDAAISSGNSGGLAVNAEGGLVGIPTAVNVDERTAAGLGGILPFTTVFELIDCGTGTVASTGGGSATTPGNSGNGGTAQQTDPDAGAGVGANAICPDGTQLTNGVEIVVVQMRPNFNYTVTALGIDGFDPVLAVQPTSGREGAQLATADLCSDDESAASNIRVNLPTTGAVSANNRTAQVVFSHSNSELMDVSFVVSDYNGSSGEFVVVLEGMAVTSADGTLGDPFQIIATPNVHASGNGIGTYMIGAETQLDPLFYIMDLSQDPIRALELDGEVVACDDAGSATCWGESRSLTNSLITRATGRTVNGDERDAMMLIPTFVGSDTLTYTLGMTSYQQNSQGQYVMAFHVSVR